MLCYKLEKYYFSLKNFIFVISWNVTCPVIFQDFLTSFDNNYAFQKYYIVFLLMPALLLRGKKLSLSFLERFGFSVAVTGGVLLKKAVLKKETQTHVFSSEY